MVIKSLFYLISYIFTVENYDISSICDYLRLREDQGHVKTLLLNSIPLTKSNFNLS